MKNELSWIIEAKQYIGLSLISCSVWLGGLANRIDTLEKEVDYAKRNTGRLIRLEDIHELKRK